MKRVIVRYTVKPEHAAENQALIEDVFASLERDRPDGIGYSVFKLADGVSFVHVTTHDSPDGVNPLTAVPAFKAFAAGVKERCAVQPVSSTATTIGRYVGRDELV
jgi:hypothetical protein